MLAQLKQIRFRGRISDESPVGKFVLGHKVGDVVEVETPVVFLFMRYWRSQNNPMQKGR